MLVVVVETMCTSSLRTGEWGVLSLCLHYAHVLHQEVGVEVLSYAGAQGVVEV